MILVTGGAGYIGSHCVLALLKQGLDVVVFDSLELGHIEFIKKFQSLSLPGKLISFIQGNLLNQQDIVKVFKQFKIDAVIHFAAYSQVAESMINPGKYFRNNVCGSLNLLDAMVENQVKFIVFSSTAAIYGEPKYSPIDENHPKFPINPYGESKLMVETIMDDYDRAFGLKSVRLRYFNATGADSLSRVGEWHSPETHLIPNILLSSQSKTFKLFGTDYQTRDGTCIRDYIDVEDLATAHLQALRYLQDGNPTNYFNLGTNAGSTVKEVFSTCEKVTGKQIPYDICERRLGDPAELIADNSKAQKILNWRPVKSLQDSIFSALNFFKQNKQIKG